MHNLVSVQYDVCVFFVSLKTGSLYLITARAFFLMRIGESGLV